LPLLQIKLAGVVLPMAQVGSGLTVTIPSAGMDVHAFEAVTVTVYVVVLAGETVMEEVVAPVLHK
jgi:hypothetical protein